MSQPLELTFNFLTAGIVVELNQYFDTSPANITDYQVNWGDGNSDTTFVHTYNAAGTYKISISATTLIHFGPHLYYPNTTIQYLTAINSWGTLPIEDFSFAFVLAINLVSVPNTLPDSARNLASMFQDCTTFNSSNISAWDVSEVISFSKMFFNCAIFNKPLNNWNIGHGFYMSNMFEYTSMSAINYSATLVGWADQIPNVQYGVNVFMYGLTYNPAGAAARLALSASPYNWVFEGDVPETPAPLELTFNFPANTTIDLNDYFDTSAANLTGYQVNWGDETFDTTFVHTYNAAGTYKISISATTLLHFGPNTYSPVLTIEYLTAVNSWGTLPIENFSYAFPGAVNLVSVPATLPSSAIYLTMMFAYCNNLNDPNISSWDVSQVISFNKLFFYCTSFNQPLNSWTTSQVTYMGFTFSGCSIFDQPLNNWNIGQVTSMESMFDNSDMSTANYSATLEGWAAQKPNVQANVIVGAEGLFYNEAGAAARSLLAADPSFWTFSGDAPAPTPLPATLPMILEYTSSVPFTLTLPLDFDFFGPDNIAANLTIDWDDGTVDTNISISLPTHTYAAAGTFQVKIYADYVRVYGFIAVLQGMEYLTTVVQFGELQTVVFFGAFAGATILTSVPAALPTDIDGDPQIVSTYAMFYGCSSFNQNINGWNVESVSSFVFDDISFSMGVMFSGCTSFNQPLNDWDVKNTTNMVFMFYGCTKFNQPLNDWDVSKVIDMYRMFDLSGLRPTNYSNMLRGWAALPLLQSGVFLSNGPAYNASAVSARSTLTGSKGWIIEDGGLNEALPMNLEYTSSVPFTLTLPLDFDFFGTDNIAANLTIDWGDGTVDTNISISLPTHTYAAAGTFQVKIYADYVRVYGVLNLLQGREYLTKVVQWGELQTVAFIAAFQGATNLTGVPEALPTDIDGSPQILSTFGMFANCVNFNQNINSWNVESVSSFVNNGTSYSMEFMFYGCTSFDQPLNDWDVGNVLIMFGMFNTCTIFNQPLNDWDVKNVTLMVFMFYGCTKFNQPLNNWDVSKVINMYGMFTLSGLRPTNYSNMLRGWAALPLLQSGVTLSDGPAYNASAVSARSTLTGSKGWIIDDGGLNELMPMILEYTSDVSFTLTLPLDFESFDPDNIAANLTIDWDDGTVDTNISTSLPTHTYAGRANDAYEVKIYADYVRVYGVLYLLQGREYLTRVLQFGELQTAAFIGAFQGATSLFSVPAALPTDIDGNPQIVSTFVMFASCSNFNQDISGWNVSQVVNMDGMFYGCTSFDKSLNNWDVTKVSIMAGMFYGCTDFNQPLNDWDVSLVNNMDVMFRECTSFNQSLNAWDVGNVAGMAGMFYECAIFNQPLNDWDVGNVTRMNAMFYGCTDFNQPLNNWNVGEVTEMSGMFTNSGLRPTNYSNMLRGWAALPLLQSGVTLSDGPAYNASAVIPRSTLTGSKGWTISDGGLNEALPMILQFDSTTLPFTISLALNFTNFGVDNIAPNLTVDWGDGVVTNNAGPHTYTNKKNQQVNIYADYVRNFGSTSTPTGIEYLTVVSQWGLLQTTGFIVGFYNARNLLIVPNQLPMDINGSAQVTSTNSMFLDCKKMNSIFLKTWDVSAVTDMTNMFTSCTAFNQPLKTWDVSAVTLMINVFGGCTAFNQDLSSWNVENVTNLQALFSNCINFQSDLGGWPVQNVLSFDGMFFNCKKFTADLSRWNIASATSMSGLFANSGMTAEDYSSTLIGWAAKLPLQANVQLGAQGVYYLSVATKARNFLTAAPYNWTITDNGILPFPLMPATFTQLQQVVYKFDIDIKTWTPAKTQQVITYSAYIFNVSAKQITATVKAGSVIVTLLIGSPTPPPPVQPSWKCEYVCPPRVLPKPNAAFNGNTNILTTANTNAFRYSKLVSHRNRNGQSISLPNPLANALFGLNGAPPRNKF